jgi:hypothetical protein
MDEILVNQKLRQWKISIKLKYRMYIKIRLNKKPIAFVKEMRISKLAIA